MRSICHRNFISTIFINGSCTRQLRNTFIIMFGRIRNSLYKAAALLGDLGALMSLNPRKILARYARKQVFKKGGNFINRKLQ